MKKILSIIMALVVLATFTFFAVGSGDKDTEEPTTESTTENKTETDVATTEPETDETELQTTEKQTETTTKKATEISDIDKAYYDVVNKYRLQQHNAETNFYMIGDIDKNNVDDLIIFFGNFELDYRYCIYSYANGSPVLVEEMGATHSVLFKKGTTLILETPTQFGPIGYTYFELDGTKMITTNGGSFDVPKDDSEMGVALHPDANIVGFRGDHF